MKGALVPNQRKGGSNLKDQNNFVHRKARQKADETKTQYKCVNVDSFKCCAAFWLNDETLMVEKPNHEHNHGPPLLEMLARNVLGFCFSAKFKQLLIHWNSFYIYVLMSQNMEIIS